MFCQTIRISLEKKSKVVDIEIAPKHKKNIHDEDRVENLTN